MFMVNLNHPKDKVGTIRDSFKRVYPESKIQRKTEKFSLLTCPEHV